MLSQENRLKKGEDIHRVFRHGKTFLVSQGLLVKVINRNNQKPLASSWCRVAFSFSKKHLPRAVDRNYLRRLIVRSLVGKQNVAVDMVFFLTAKPIFEQKEDIESGVARLMQKVYTTTRQ